VALADRVGVLHDQKLAIAHLTKCHAVEWGKYNITVNAVAPTFIRTPGDGELSCQSRVPVGRDRAYCRAFTELVTQWMWRAWSYS